MQQTIDVQTSIFFAFIAIFFSFIDINVAQMVILAILMLIDFFTGIAKSYRLEPSSIKSCTALIGIMSKLLYLLVPIVLALAMKGLSIQEFGIWIVNFSINAMILAEAYSILANIYMFKSKVKIAEVDAVSYILKAIKNQLEKMIR